MTPPPASSSRKRSLPPNERSPRRDRERDSRARREEDELPWWEQDRRGGERGGERLHASRREYEGRGTSGRGGYDDTQQPRDRREYDNRDGGGRGYQGGPSRGGSVRGGRGGRGGYGDDRRDDRRDYSYDRGYSRGPPPPSREDFEEGEIPVLNYSDKPIVPPIPPPVSTPVAAPSVPEPAADPVMELDLEVPAEPDLEALIAERRRKRAEILAKYSATATPVDSRAQTPEVGTPGRKEVERETKRLRIGTDSPMPHAEADFDLFKDADANEASRIVELEVKAEHPFEEEVSAADYNPDEDRKLDDRRHAERNAQPVKEEVQPQVDLTMANDDDDDDDDDADDMFSLGHKPVALGTSATATFVPVINRSLDEAGGGLTDNFDDAEGYYKLVLGELLDNGRYHVHANLGKGMFSGVVRAKDLESPTGEDVAIKVIRSQESMYKAGMKEANILRKLQEADPDDKKHVIRLLRTFEHRGHLCLVFEMLSMNLREVVKRFGKDVGINLRAVRAYASQMFLGLALMKKCEIMHADIKPDNILVSESKSVLKICDLGSASDVSENDITPYLASRFYRAPEIILGLPYDTSLDTWAVGCTLYELYTGKILFPGRTNNHMLLLIMELKGKFLNKMVKKARFGDQHFDESANFVSLEKNGATKVMAIPSKAPHDLRSRLMPASAIKKLKEDEISLLSKFVDLLDKMLTLDPAKRITPKDMLSHPFLRS